MKLYIDTSGSEKIIVGINGERVEAESRRDKAQKLLSLIVEELGKKGKSLQDIQEIRLNPGPGSFTGLRVGVSVANTLAWSLDIPVNGRKQVVEPVYQ